MTMPFSRPSTPIRRRAWLAVLRAVGACGCVVLAGSWPGASGALAATQTHTLDVNTSIPVSCTVVALADMAFSAAIVSTATQSHDAQGSFRVNCTNAGTYGVSIPVSANGSGTQRRLHSSATGDYLSYDVFASTAHRTAAGPLYTTGASGAPDTGQAGNGNNQDFVLYGRIPAQTAPATGTYTDTLTVTVGY